MKLLNAKTLISHPEIKNSSQEDIIKTLGNREIDESVAISIGTKILAPYFFNMDLARDEVSEDFASKLIGEDVLIKVCTNLIGKVDTETLIGINGHVAKKNFEVLERLGQHDVEVDHFSMDEQGILVSGRVRFTILAYKVKPTNEVVPRSHSFSLIMHSYFDKVITKQLGLPEAYGSLYSHHESKLRDTIITESDLGDVVNNEFNRVLTLIEQSVVQSDNDLKRFLKALC